MNFLNNEVCFLCCHTVERILSRPFAAAAASQRSTDLHMAANVQGGDCIPVTGEYDNDMYNSRLAWDEHVI